MNRKEIDKLIKNMDLFPSLKAVISEYKTDTNELVERQNELKDKLQALQEEHTENYKKQSDNTDISKLIELQKQNKSLRQEIEVIKPLLERLDNELTQLKLDYVQPFRDAIQKDNQAMNGKYNANEVVNQLRWEMVSIISELSNAMQGQYREVIEDVLSVFNDPKVKEVHPRLEYAFTPEHYKPIYSEANNTVISRYHLFQARDGQIARDIKPPNKGVKSNGK